MQYLYMFVLFTGLAFAVRGMAAIRWSDGVLQSVRTNLALGLAHHLIYPYPVFVIVGAGQAVLRGTVVPHVSVHAWDHVPFVLAALAYALAHDFLDYWTHRLLHLRGFWDIHAVHHSDTDMNWTTTYRVHLIEPLMMQASYLLIAIFTGLPPLGAAAGFVVFTLYNAFVHLDLDIHFGPFTRVLATPRFHRWHHADTPDAYNTNFANIFAFWDVLFGTYRVPGAYKGPLGFEGTPGHNLPKLLVWPFLQWSKALPRFRRPAAANS